MRWTAEEDRILKDNCGKGYKPLLALLPNRDKEAISRRARRKDWLVCPNITRDQRARLAVMSRATIAATRGKGACIKWLRQHVVHRSDECLIWPFSFSGDCGYLGYFGKNYSAAALMCEMVYGPKPTRKHKAGRTCGETACVHPGHLKWMTQSGIWAAHKASGTRFGKAKGDPRRKLTEADVVEIRSLKGIKTQRAIGAIFRVSYLTVGDVLRGRTWVTGKKIFGGSQSTPRGIITTYRTISGTDRARNDLEYINSIVPRDMLGRDDIMQEMWLALATGRATRESLNYRDFTREFYRNNFEQSGHAVSFDDIAFALS
jgi:hypothetical protein